MRVVFLGASHFGLKCLQALAGLQPCVIGGVVTAPRKFRISYSTEGVTNVLHAPVGAYCEEEGLPYMELRTGMKDPELWDAVSAWKPDLFVVAGWYHMVPASWRARAPAYGLHGSLLPCYRGGAPLVWALINGEPEVGITLFQFDEGVDTGPILAQARTPVDFSDTIATVYARIEDLGVQLLIDALPRLAEGTAVLVPQDPGAGSSFPQRSPADGVIDWQWPAERVYNFIRAQTKPYPGAFFIQNGKKIVVWSALPCVANSDLAPGDLKREDGQWRVGASGGAVQLGLIEVDGVELSASDWTPEVSA